MNYYLEVIKDGLSVLIPYKDIRFCFNVGDVITFSFNGKSIELISVSTNSGKININIEFEEFNIGSVEKITINNSIENSYTVDLTKQIRRDELIKNILDESNS